MNNAAQTIALKDVAHIRAGHPFRGAVEVFADGSVAVVQMKDILPSGQIDWASTVCTELMGRKDPDWLKQGDLLFISRGNRYHAAYVDQPPPFAVCGAHLFHLTVRDPGVVLNYRQNLLVNIVNHTQNINKIRINDCLKLVKH